jgi:glycogen debranching enzyme
LDKPGHRSAENGEASDINAIETRWLEAAAQLREMAEFEAERKKALERFVSEANEESWREWHRLLLSRAVPDR